MLFACATTNPLLLLTTSPSIYIKEIALFQRHHHPTQHGLSSLNPGTVQSASQSAKLASGAPVYALELPAYKNNSHSSSSSTVGTALIALLLNNNNSQLDLVNCTVFSIVPCPAASTMQPNCNAITVNLVDDKKTKHTQLPFQKELRA